MYKGALSVIISKCSVKSTWGVFSHLYKDSARIINNNTTSMFPFNTSQVAVHFWCLYKLFSSYSTFIESVIQNILPSTSYNSGPFHWT